MKNVIKKHRLISVIGTDIIGAAGGAATGALASPLKMGKGVAIGATLGAGIGVGFNYLVLTTKNLEKLKEKYKNASPEERKKMKEALDKVIK